MATEWTWLMWEEPPEDGHYSEIKPHLAPSTNNIVEHVVKDITGRFTAEGRRVNVTRKISRKCLFDLPGMIMADRSWISFPLDNVKIHVPSADVEGILGQLEDLKLRWFEVGGKRRIPYYKMHFWNRCLCMTPNQRVRLEARMTRALPKCRAIAEHEARVWNDRMADIEKKTKHVRMGRKPVHDGGEA